MHSRRLVDGLLFLALAAAPAAAQNTPLNRTGSGARAAGMANAFVAVSDDGTAASWNPAGLAQLRKPEFSLVLTSLDEGFHGSGFRSIDERFAYSTRSFGSTTSSLDFAALAVPFDLFGKPTTLQLGWRRPFQLSARAHEALERGPGFASQGEPDAHLLLDRNSEGNIDLISAAAAVRLTSRLLLGGSLDFARGDWEQSLVVAQAPGLEGHSDFLAAENQQQLRGHNFNLGLLLVYPKLNVGLVYHAPAWLDYREDVRLDTSLFEPVQSSSAPGARFRYPLSFALGVAVRPSPDWTLSADLTRDEWAQTVVEGLSEGSGPTNFFDGLPQDRTSTRDVFSLNVGAERLVRGDGFVVPIRFGFAWEPQGPIDPVLRDPVAFGMVSAGSGYNTNRFKLDAAFQYRWSHSRQAAQLGLGAVLAGIPDAVGPVQQDEWRLKLSVIVRVTDTEKLHGLLHRVFVGEDEPGSGATQQ
jgi:long-subunit fatty acid transport protein